MKYRRKKSSILFTLLLFAMAISCCMAVTAFAANTPDVKKHTKEEIKAYIESDRERGISMLFISHNLKVVRKLCSRVAVMQRGLLVETGNTDDVFFRPQHPYTKHLIEAIPTRERRSS